MGLPVHLHPLQAALWISAPPQVESDSSCSAETGPSAPVAMALQHQPGQSGRRRVSEPLLLKPEQDTQPMGRVAEWSHHGNLSPEVPTGFLSPYLVCGGRGRGRLGFLNSFFCRKHPAACGGHPGVTAGVHDKKTSSMSQKGPQLSRTQLQMSPSSLFPQMLGITCVCDLSSSPQLCLAPSVLRNSGRLQKNPHSQSKKRTVGLTSKDAFLPCSFVVL